MAVQRRGAAPHLAVLDDVPDAIAANVEHLVGAVAGDMLVASTIVAASMEGGRDASPRRPRGWQSRREPAAHRRGMGGEIGLRGRRPVFVIHAAPPWPGGDGRDPPAASPWRIGPNAQPSTSGTTIVERRAGAHDEEVDPNEEDEAERETMDAMGGVGGRRHRSGGRRESGFRYHFRTVSLPPARRGESLGLC